MNKQKILVSLLGLVLTVSASAQNMYDAINFSKNEYFGTARTIALNNAVTALGGDLGTMTINPAGSAVSRYGQFSITPALSISASNSSYSADGISYMPGQSISRNKVTLPNCSGSLVFDTNRSKGLKSFTLAFAVSQTAQYHSYAQSIGNNPYSSKMGEFAVAADGIEEAILSDRRSFDNSSVSWDVLTAYQGGMFGSFGYDGVYAGVSEAINNSGESPYMYIPGTLTQTSITSKGGSKNDFIMNFGFNISDKLFLGFNLGLPTAEYYYNENFYEAAINPELFPISYESASGEPQETFFKTASYAYRYDSDIKGVYAKLGFIYVPIKGLRIGAAFQTPSSYTIEEEWKYYARTDYLNSAFNQRGESPDGEYEYTLRTPYSASFGLAYTLGKIGLISIDYELTDYSVMRFKSLDYDAFNLGEYMAVNEANRNFAGVTSNLRLGIEFKPLPSLAVRAGYGFTTCPEKHYTNELGEDVTVDDYLADFDSYVGPASQHRLVHASYYEDKTTTISGGLGYSSNGSFFADLAFSRIKYPDQVFSPYFNYEVTDSTGAILDISSPKVLILKSLWTAALTIGWRF